MGLYMRNMRPLDARSSFPLRCAWSDDKKKGNISSPPPFLSSLLNEEMEENKVPPKGPSSLFSSDVGS